MKATLKAQHVLLMSFLAAAAAASNAQVIQMSNKPFDDKPVLPFAPPSKNGLASGMPIAPPPSAKSLAIKPDAKQVEAPAAAPISIELVKGKRVDDQFRAFAKQSGWDLVWQAPEYVVDRDMKINGEFENVLLSFLNGANEAGTRLRAVFYRGNKTVRITEF